jgi:LysM repeat protein
MTTLEGVDYSYARPSASGLVKAGKKFAVRYITTPGPGNKGISQAEYDTLTKAGIAVAFVWEDGPSSALAGRARGIGDARRAQANLNALKGPSNQRPIYFAVDTDTSAQAVTAYFQGVVSVIGKRRTGVYGSYRVCAGLKAAGLVSFLWQTYAWSGGQQLPGRNLFQYRNGQPLAGGQVDLCRAYTSNYGQRAVLLSKPAPKPAPTPTPTTEHRFHTVQSGDTLTALAAKYGHSVSTIAGWNGITDPNRIYIGQRLRVS